MRCSNCAFWTPMDAGEDNEIFGICSKTGDGEYRANHLPYTTNFGITAEAAIATHEDHYCNKWQDENE